MVPTARHGGRGAAGRSELRDGPGEAGVLVVPAGEVDIVYLLGRICIRAGFGIYLWDDGAQ